MPEPGATAGTGVTATDSYRFVYPVDVRFRDLDSMGHAHHTLALIYLEEARAAYWRDVAGRDTVGEIDYVMAEVTVRYHSRIEYPGRLTVGLRTGHIGSKSFVMEFTITDAGGQPMASGRTVQVMYDYAAGAPKPVPDDLRKRIEVFENGS